MQQPFGGRINDLMQAHDYLPDFGLAWQFPETYRRFAAV
jgi:hypothetical protein